jgi:hypothetical protein
MRSAKLIENDPTFKALIMAAMRKADSSNIAKLKHAWPDIWDELHARYNAVGGWLPGEINNDGEVVK